MPMESANLMLFHWLSVPDPSGSTLFWLSALAQWPLFGLPVLLVGLWLFGARGERDVAVAAGVTCCVALLAAHVASIVIDHPRPFMMGLAANVFDHAPDSSFPERSRDGCCLRSPPPSRFSRRRGCGGWVLPSRSLGSPWGGGVWRWACTSRSISLERPSSPDCQNASWRRVSCAFRSAS